MGPSDTPYHFVVVRDDLSPGARSAQLLHAAGESAADWCLHHPGQPFPAHTRAVVLTVPGELELAEVAAKLTARGIPHTEVREPDMADQLTAVGVALVRRQKLAAVLGRLPLFTGGER